MSALLAIIQDVLTGILIAIYSAIGIGVIAFAVIIRRSLRREKFARQGARGLMIRGRPPALPHPARKAIPARRSAVIAGQVIRSREEVPR